MKKLLGFGLLSLAAFAYLVYREMKAMDAEKEEDFSFEETPDELLLSLDSNSASGYAWRVLDGSPLLSVESVDVFPSVGEEGESGLADITEIRFRLLAEGEALIHLQYGRPWEGGEKEEPLAVRIKIIAKEGHLYATILSIDKKAD